MTGRLNRRQALASLGTVSLGALLTACGGDERSPGPVDVTTTEGTSTSVRPRSDGSLSELFEDAPACTLSPQGTEGPYYFDAEAIRGDIREGREGATLRLALRVRTAGRCEPLGSAVVDIWHCDARGVYSGFESASRGGGPPAGGPNDGETYLRGAQVTNSDGIVEFTTIYPGWYPGRTPHIHAKVHVDRRTVLTTQLYFDDDLTTTVYRREPYASARRRTDFNETDGIFDRRLVLSLSRDGDGYLGVFSFDVERA